MVIMLRRSTVLYHSKPRCLMGIETPRTVITQYFVEKTRRHDGVRMSHCEISHSIRKKKTTERSNKRQSVPC